MEMFILMIFWGFSVKAQIFQAFDSWEMEHANQSKENTANPISFDHAANSLLFELPKTCLKCLTCQLPNPRNIWFLMFRWISTNVIYNLSKLFPQKLSLSHLFWIKLGCLHLPETVKALMFIICRGQQLAKSRPFPKTLGVCKGRSCKQGFVQG